jgi:prepilin-type N-terminal cleavage/methylation domain-containing protein
VNFFKQKSIIERRADAVKAQRQWLRQMRAMAGEITAVTTDAKPIRGQKPRIYLVKGFSLIELSVAMLVAAILASLAMPSFLHQNEENQIKAAIADTKELRLDLATDVLTCGQSPTSMTMLPRYVYTLQPPALCGTCAGNICSVPSSYYVPGQVGSHLNIASLVPIPPPYNSNASAAWQIQGTMISSYPMLNNHQIWFVGMNVNGAMAWQCADPVNGSSFYKC